MSTYTSRQYRLLWCAAVIATVAVFVLPAAFIALRGFTGESALVTASKAAFISADLNGHSAHSDDLANLTARWREFHILKAFVAAVLAAVLARLAWGLRRDAELARRGDRRWHVVAAYGGVVLWVLAALTVLVANVQGAVAPLASVASLLPTEQPQGQLTTVLSEIRRAVTVDQPATGDGLASDLLGDFTLYHAVLAVMAAFISFLLGALALRAVLARWRVRRTGVTPGPTWVVEVSLYAPAGCFFLLLALANTSTWVDPVPALLASLGGS